MNNEEVDRLLAQAVREAEPNELYKYRFAKLVAAAEREECAKVCETYNKRQPYNDEDMVVANECAFAIRERGAP
jgi:hypothetical protein